MRELGLKRTRRYSTATVAALVGGSIGVGVLGCSDGEPLNDTAVATRQQAATSACFDPVGLNSTRAALAVAVARELREIDPIRQFRKDCSKPGCPVALTPEAFAICAPGSNGCQLIRSILALQDDSLRDNPIPQNVFNPTTFREELKAGIQRQIDHEADLARNQPWRLPERHFLTFFGTEEISPCGLHFAFDAVTTQCAPGVATCPLQDPSRLKERFEFFGGYGPTRNPFIDFLVSNGRILIDPAPPLSGDLPPAAPNCVAASYWFDPGAALVGRCCVKAPGAAPSSFETAAWDPRVSVCR